MAAPAAQAVLGSGWPDRTRTIATLTMSSAATAIWTIVSGPDRSAAAWAANPPIWAVMPSNQAGLRTRRASSFGHPADETGTAAACCCSRAAPIPYRTAASSAQKMVSPMGSTLKKMYRVSHGTDSRL